MICEYLLIKSKKAECTENRIKTEFNKNEIVKIIMNYQGKEYTINELSDKAVNTINTVSNNKKIIKRRKKENEMAAKKEKRRKWKEKQEFKEERVKQFSHTWGLTYCRIQCKNSYDTKRCYESCMEDYRY